MMRFDDDGGGIDQIISYICVSEEVFFLMSYNELVRFFFEDYYVGKLKFYVVGLK